VQTLADASAEFDLLRIAVSEDVEGLTGFPACSAP
jgi:hypothetical protein